MSQHAWLTVDDLPAARTTRTITLPDGEPWLAILRGALSLLIYEENFEQHGTLSPAEMADEWHEVFNDFEEALPVITPPGLIAPFAGGTVPAGWLLADGSEVSRSTYADLFAAIGTVYGAGNGTTTFDLPSLSGRVPVGYYPELPELGDVGDVGGERDHTLTSGEMPVHTHVQNSHNHTQDSHTHVQNSHNHNQNSHTHVQNPHNHPPGSPYWTTGINVTIASGPSFNQPFTTETSPNATAVNQSTTPTNIATTPTNQIATAVNQATTPTNQNAGGGGAHNNMPPYLVLNYIIKL